MPETTAKKPIDHKGAFWIHYTDLLAMSAKKNVDATHRMTQYAWVSIPTEWRADGKTENMANLEKEYESPKRDPELILLEMIQLISDTALECGLIDKKRKHYI